MYVLAYKDSSFIEKGDINTARDQLTQDCLKELRKMDPSELEKRVRSALNSPRIAQHWCLLSDAVSLNFCESYRVCSICCISCGSLVKNQLESNGFSFSWNSFLEACCLVF